MTAGLRRLLAVGSAAVVALVNATAIALGPEDARHLLLLCGLLAVGAAVQSAAWDPAALAPALLLSLPPVVALLGDGSPSWLIGPLGAMLLVAAELNALGWELHAAAPSPAVMRRRLLDVGRLGALGLAAALAVGAVARVPSPGGTVAVVLAATALAALGYLLFGRAS